LIRLTSSCAENRGHGSDTVSLDEIADILLGSSVRRSRKKASELPYDHVNVGDGIGVPRMPRTAAVAATTMPLLRP
jgi:hypothetical protein